MSNLIAQAFDTEALGEAFMELLVGLILFMPVIELVIGAGAGTLAGKYAGVVADDRFIKETGDSIEPGNFSRFLLACDAMLDNVKVNFGANSLMVGKICSEFYVKE